MMKKLIIAAAVVFVSVSVFASVPQTGRVSTYLRGTLSSDFVSENIYSYPGKDGSIHYALGADVTADFYRNDSTQKWGISTALHASCPLWGKHYENFVSSSLSSSDAFLMLGAGAVFRCTPYTYLDASLALRLGVMTYDYFTKGIILGVTVEPRVDYFLTESVFITGDVSLTSGFIKFTPASSTTWYDSGYTTLLFSVKLGCGIRFGEERKR